MSYTIVEPDIISLLNSIDDSSEVPYGIVGGLASQILIANALNKDFNLTLKDLSNKSTPFFRPTEDMDLATLVSKDDDGKITKDFRNTLIQLSDRGYGIEFHKEKNKENVFDGKIKYGEEKNCSVRLNFNIEETTGVPHEYYTKIIENAERINIPYKGKTALSVNVISINDLIVNKLGGYVLGGRQKDLQDIIYNMIFNESRINEEYVSKTIETYFPDKKEKLISAYQEAKKHAAEGKDSALKLIQ